MVPDNTIPEHIVELTTALTTGEVLSVEQITAIRDYVDHALTETNFRSLPFFPTTKQLTRLNGNARDYTVEIAQWNDRAGPSITGELRGDGSVSGDVGIFITVPYYQCGIYVLLSPTAKIVTIKWDIELNRKYVAVTKANKTSGL